MKLCSDKRVLSGGFRTVFGLCEGMSCDFKIRRCICNGLIRGRWVSTLFHPMGRDRSMRNILHNVVVNDSAMPSS